MCAGAICLKIKKKANEEDQKTSKNRNKWRDILWSWIEKLNMVKMLILKKVIYRFNTTPVKIPGSLIVYIDNLILNSI